jgi:hypothetical protein
MCGVRKRDFYLFVAIFFKKPKGREGSGATFFNDSYPSFDPFASFPTVGVDRILFDHDAAYKKKDFVE